MIVDFSLEFKSFFGQNVYLCGSISELGAGDPLKAVKCDFNEGFLWTKQIKIAVTKNRVFTYYYFIKDDSGKYIYETGDIHSLAFSTNTKSVKVYNKWIYDNYLAPFLSSPFADVFFMKEGKRITKTHYCAREIILKAFFPNTKAEESVFICGDHPYLGGWDTEKALPLSSVTGTVREIHLPAEKIHGDISFKFLKKGHNGSIQWEEGNNHELHLDLPEANQTLIYDISVSNFPLSYPRFAGTAVPLFSLRSKNSEGIGDFNDIKLLADWMAKTGQSVIQLLPINDTTITETWTDSYPYNCISVMALHPIYINLGTIGKISDPTTLEEFKSERERLNSLEKVDYEAVWRFKQKYLRILFDLYGDDTFARPEQYAFYKKNKNWLLKYAAFCTLRDRFKSADFSKWKKYSQFSNDIINELNIEGSDTYKEFSFHLFTQFHLHSQLEKAVEYTHSRGVAIKGDIPIGISPFSVEAWTEPHLFNMDRQAGAPPDDFAANGQNWGFPTYNWEEMAKDSFQWWRNRLIKMSDYFDTYRIDHILGFFRIWEIPSDQISGTLGSFNPALPYTEEEIRSYGFPFDKNLHTRPHLTAALIRERLGGAVEKASMFFFENDNNLFRFKEEYSTQKKINGYLEKNKKSIKEMFELKDGKHFDNFRDSILSLFTEILFIEDSKKEGLYHPRITAQFTSFYSQLSEGEKNAFNSLYNDFFYNRHNRFWAEQAIIKLPGLISSTNMLACAEDLGMIPSCVPEVLDKLRIATLEIQRMPKDTSVYFANPMHYPYLSVCSVGTHDMSSLRGWWEEDVEKTQFFYNHILGQTGEAPQHCEPWISQMIISQHLYSSSMFAIMPIQDWFSMEDQLRIADPQEERINIPANPKHYWRYRIQVYLEDLIKNSKINDKISQMIKHSNRSI